MDGSDSLPYYDTDIDRVAGLRESLESIISAELAAVPLDSIDISSRLPLELPSAFAGSPFLAAELDRVSSGKKITNGLDSVRYTLPAPPSNAPASAWNKALDNAASQLEHQQLRLGNLELMHKYGSNSWRVGNFLLEKEIERIEVQTAAVREQTEALNRERKARQLEAGDRLSSLEARWTTLVSGNLQLEIANLQMDLELDGLREREEELRAQLTELQQQPS